jgi:hypothetical protein
MPEIRNELGIALVFASEIVPERFEVTGAGIADDESRAANVEYVDKRILPRSRKRMRNCCAFA